MPLTSVALRSEPEFAANGAPHAISGNNKRWGDRTEAIEINGDHVARSRCPVHTDALKDLRPFALCGCKQRGIEVESTSDSGVGARCRQGDGEFSAGGGTKTGATDFGK